MAKSLGTLTLDMLLKIGAFERDTDKVSKSTQKRMKEIEKAAASAGKTVGLALSAGVAAAIYAINEAQKSVGNLQDMSEKIGDTAENFASLKKASDVTGVSMDTVATASVKLTAVLSKTDDESKGAGAAIEALGLNFDQFRQLQPVDQLDAVAKAMQNFKDGSEKTAVAVALFGKSGAEVLPFLNELATSSKRQVTLTSEQIKAADDYGGAVAGLKSEIGLLIDQTAVDFIPTQEKLLKLVRDSIAGFRELSQASDFAQAETEVRALQAQIEHFEKGGAILSTFGRDVNGELETLRGKLATAQAELKKFTDQAIGSAIGLDRFKQAAVSIPSKYYVFGSGDKPTLEFDQAAIDAANKAREEAEKKRKKAIEDAAADAKRAQEQMAAAGKSMADSLATPDEALKTQTDLIDKLYNGKYIDAETRTRALAEANAKYYDSIVALDPALKAQLETEKMLQNVIDDHRREQQQAADYAVRNSPAGGTFAGVDAAVGTASGLEEDRYQKQREELQAALEQEGVDRDLAHQAIEAAEQAHQDRLAQIAADGQQAKNEVMRTYLQAGNDIFGNLSNAAQSLGLEKSKKGFEISKHINAVQAGLNTATAVTNALAVPPYPLGLALAISAGLAGAAQIAVIESAKFPGYATGGLVAGGRQLIEVNERGQEFVMPAEATRANRGLLEAMRAGMPIIAPPTARAAPANMIGSAVSGGFQLNIQNAPPGYRPVVDGNVATLDMLQPWANRAIAGSRAATTQSLVSGRGPESQAFKARYSVPGKAQRNTA